MTAPTGPPHALRFPLRTPIQRAQNFDYTPSTAPTIPSRLRHSTTLDSEDRQSTCRTGSQDAAERHAILCQKLAAGLARRARERQDKPPPPHPPREYEPHEYFIDYSDEGDDDEVMLNIARASQGTLDRTRPSANRTSTLSSGAEVRNVPPQVDTTAEDDAPRIGPIRSTTPPGYPPLLLVHGSALVHQTSIQVRPLLLPHRTRISQSEERRNTEGSPNTGSFGVYGFHFVADQSYLAKQPDLDTGTVFPVSEAQGVADAQVQNLYRQINAAAAIVDFGENKKKHMAAQRFNSLLSRFGHASRKITGFRAFMKGVISPQWADGRNRTARGLLRELGLLDRT